MYEDMVISNVFNLNFKNIFFFFFFIGERGLLEITIKSRCSKNGYTTPYEIYMVHRR